jgi:hypothetical protein
MWPTPSMSRLGAAVVHRRAAKLERTAAEAEPDREGAAVTGGFVGRVKVLAAGLLWGLFSALVISAFYVGLNNAFEHLHRTCRLSKKLADPLHNGLEFIAVWSQSQ